MTKKIIDLFNFEPLDPANQSAAFRAGIDAVKNMASQDDAEITQAPQTGLAGKLKALFTVAAAFTCKKAREVKAFLSRSFPMAMIVALALMPTSCAPSWEQPTGMSPQAWEQVKADCALEAAYKAPPRNAYAFDAGSAFESTNCHKNNCSSYSSYTPPHVEQIDLNQPLRKQVTDACLAKHGGIKNGL